LICPFFLFPSPPLGNVILWLKYNKIYINLLPSPPLGAWQIDMNYYNNGMTVRSIVFSEGEFYHLYSRGVDKRLIFIDDFDKKRFVRLLFLCNGSRPVVYREVKNLLLKDIDMGQKLVAIGAYCLMPNHFHLLIKETTEGGIVKFMSKLLTAYSTYFNKRYERAGHLFSGEFKSSHLDRDEYLKYIFSYIHLNPIKLIQNDWKERGILNKNQAEKYLNDYKYSSYLDYTDFNRDEGLILNKEFFPNYFENIRDMEKEVKSWLSFQSE